jgi:hypothetical protein
MKHKWALPLVFALTLPMGLITKGYINPRFTPKDLERDSDLILQLELKATDAKGVAVATVTKVLKGEYKDKEITFDFLAMPVPMQAQGKAVIEAMAAGEHAALFFAGRFQAEGTGMEGGGDKIAGLLHHSGKWSILSLAEGAAGGGKVWEMEKIDEKMLGTFSGGTDMLLRCMTYVLTDPNSEVPVVEKVDWGQKVEVGKTDRKVNAVAAVDLAGDGKLAAFLASPGGDLVYRWNGKAMEDLTAKLGLRSASSVFAWGDFNRDGKLDLASWNGKQLRIHWQKTDGAFAATDVKAGAALRDGCLSLTVLDVGNKPGLLVGTKAWPVILSVKEDGSAEAKPIGAGEFPAKDAGATGQCLVSDFDGDSFPDVVQLCAKGGLFYKGKAPGWEGFASPVRNAVAFGQGRYSACLGDYDHDGLPEIIVVSTEDVPCLYQNLGEGRFSNVLPRSGSFEYISKPGGTGCQTIDINNDGRQDIFVAYETGMAPQVFFNRGFRCFGLSRKLEAQVQEMLPQAAEGQQAGCVADFTGDNAMDMFLVLGNGELCLVPRQAEDPPLAVVATLSAASQDAGPVVVSAIDPNKRSLGAWTISAGGPGAFFGMAEKGTLTLKWRRPGGAMQERQVVVEDKAVRVVLDKAD